MSPHRTVQVVDIPARIASSEVESHSTAGPHLQAADSLADARLSVTRRSDTRDLWDDALLGIVGARLTLHIIC